MKVWAVTMVRNEEDIIGFTLRHMISEGMDGIVVADNLSTDRTRDVLEAVKREAPIPFLLLEDREPGYYQSRKMTALAHLAAEKGAHYVIPFDADELWFSLTPEPVAGVLRHADAPVARIDLWNHFASASDPEEENPFLRMPWRMEKRSSFSKTAFRYRPDLTVAQGNHDVLGADGIPVEKDPVPVGIRHFPYRGPDHFIHKAMIGGAAYAATDLASNQGNHWRRFKRILDSEGPRAVEEIFFRDFWFSDPQKAGMVHDPAPYLKHARGRL